MFRKFFVFALVIFMITACATQTQFESAEVASDSVQSSSANANSAASDHDANQDPTPAPKTSAEILAEVGKLPVFSTTTEAIPMPISQGGVEVPGYWQPGDSIPQEVENYCKSSDDSKVFNNINYNCSAITLAGALDQPQHCQSGNFIVGEQYRFFSKDTVYFFAVDWRANNQAIMAFANGAVGRIVGKFGSNSYLQIDMTPYAEDDGFGEQDPGVFTFLSFWLKCEEIPHE